MIKVTIKNLDLINKWLGNERERKEKGLFWNDYFGNSSLYSRYIGFKAEYIFNSVVKEAKWTYCECAYDFEVWNTKIDVKACNIHTYSTPFSYYLKKKHLKKDINFVLFFFFEGKIKDVFYVSYDYCIKNAVETEWRWVINYKINLRNLPKDYIKTHYFLWKPHI